MTKNLTYADTGVDYSAMDPIKVLFQRLAAETDENIARFDGGALKVYKASRGESAFLVESQEAYWAHVEEGLGTKNLVADEMERLTRVCHYSAIAQDTVAMIVNDMITVGALPLSLAMHLAVRDKVWLENGERLKELGRGWKNACYLAGCVWAGGETSTLKGNVEQGGAVISGSAFGRVTPKKNLIAGNIAHGDAIIIVESSGIHANGLTMVRDLASKLSQGYLSRLPSGRTFGDVLLIPTLIYAQLVEECLREGIDIHYAVNITGHGWRKLMRSPFGFTYVIEDLPREQEIFQFIQDHGPVDDREAYGNLNMGAGFALIVPEDEAERVIKINESLEGVNLLGENWSPAFVAGHVEAGPKQVVIKPKGITFVAEELAVR